MQIAQSVGGQQLGRTFERRQVRQQQVESLAIVQLEIEDRALDRVANQVQGVAVLGERRLYFTPGVGPVGSHVWLGPSHDGFPGGNHLHGRWGVLVQHVGV